MYSVVILLLFVIVQNIQGITSPLKTYTNYTYSTELQNNVADLWWSVDEVKQEIVFELHIKTTGWIALGISPAGGMTGADIGLGWVDSSSQLHFQDRYATKNGRPLIDNTTVDWFGLKGREENGWTAIQFKRPLDSCDTLDVPIKSGTNILIYAYGLTDPDPDITYHDLTRRGSRILPLRSYGNPSAESKFDGLDYFDFKLNNYAIPSTDTTYHCKVYKIPSNITTRRHVIAHKTLVESANIDIVHHVLMHECDATAKFDDNNLPDGVCDDINDKIQPCTANIATGWAVGGDAIVDFPEIAGYPVGGDFEIKYYMIQMHYDNPKKMNNRTDSTGIRFYMGNKHRQHEIGYLSLGTASSAAGVAIPPHAERFMIDSYCSSKATDLIPKSGITVVAAFPHTHLQGRSLWTKIVRNQTAVDYLFNADSYDFNYQFENRLPKPIRLFPGDELATRCIYNTMNKNEMTLGGERTKDEMCLHMLTYYPRMNNFYTCMTMHTAETFQAALNITELPKNETDFRELLMKLKWTPESIEKWQASYNNGSQYVLYGHSGDFQFQELGKLPTFKDLEPEKCKQIVEETTTTSRPMTSAKGFAMKQRPFLSLLFILLMIQIF